MPKKVHTEDQIVAVLRHGEAGEKVKDICRKVGISEGTYYADLSLHRQILQEIASKKL